MLSVPVRVGNADPGSPLRRHRTVEVAAAASDAPYAHRMAEYRVVHVQDFILNSGGQVQNVTTATAVMNQHAAEGWRVIACVPGTNAQTHGGLFITFERG